MGKCVFSDKWKANERFKAWIAADPKSRTKAKCTVCDKAINISSMGKAALSATWLARNTRILCKSNGFHLLSRISYPLARKVKGKN